MAMPLQMFMKQIEDGTLPVTVGKVFNLDVVMEAYIVLESNNVCMKIVILT